jgi:hypothetical protein
VRVYINLEDILYFMDLMDKICGGLKGDKFMSVYDVEIRE